jgi:toxin ParE1/3/4
MRPVKLSWSPRARGDIESIYEWIAPHNKRAAESVVAEIRKTGELLREYPGVGRPTNIADVQVIPVVRYAYLVYFTRVADEIVVVHVRHGARSEPTPEEFES